MIDTNPLITWNNRKKNINIAAELEFLFQCEKNCHISLIGQDRFLIILDYLKYISKCPKTILDVGGNKGTARWLEKKFPQSKVTILNKSTKEISNWHPFIEQDAENFRSTKKYDLIFLGDLIEHTYNPDGLLASSILALKPEGFIILSTPNLACIYNRLFLLFGWSLGGYYPSLRYMTGNPFFKKGSGEFGVIFDHKSVFTWKGLVELLKIYNLKIIKSSGFDVRSDEKVFKIPRKNYAVLNQNARALINNILPKYLKPGMMFLCRLEKNADLKKVAKGILQKNIWDM